MRIDVLPSSRALPLNAITFILGYSSLIFLVSQLKSSFFKK
jgi:hypothetical protein